MVDVGHTIELFADFTEMGKKYLPFPDPANFRIPLEKLTQADQRDKLRLVWTEPLSLDPSRRSAKVTRELADRLPRLAKSLEASKYDPGRVAHFLMRCLFTMFAEDVDLIPGGNGDAAFIGKGVLSRCTAMLSGAVETRMVRAEMRVKVAEQAIGVGELMCDAI